MPAVDVERLAAMLVRLGDWFAGSAAGSERDERTESVDANPVIVPRGDAAPVIVDAVVVRNAASEGTKR